MKTHPLKKVYILALISAASPAIAGEEHISRDYSHSQYVAKNLSQEKGRKIECQKILPTTLSFYASRLGVLGSGGPYRLYCVGLTQSDPVSSFSCDPTVTSATAPPGVAPCFVNTINDLTGGTDAGRAQTICEAYKTVETITVPSFQQRETLYKGVGYNLLKADMTTPTTELSEARFYHAFCEYVPH